MKSYQKFIRSFRWMFLVLLFIGAIVSIVMLIVNGVNAGNERIAARLMQAEEEQVTWEGYLRQCMVQGGRVTKITGLKACYKLTLVDRDLVHQEFWDGESMECKKIIDAVYISDGGMDGIRGCFYFELMDFTRDST